VGEQCGKSTKRKKLEEKSRGRKERRKISIIIIIFLLSEKLYTPSSILF